MLINIIRGAASWSKMRQNMQNNNEFIMQAHFNSEGQCSFQGFLLSVVEHCFKVCTSVYSLLKNAFSLDLFRHPSLKFRVYVLVNQCIKMKC